MAQREFDITIGADGNVELHVKGFKGRSCLEALKLFKEIVGDETSRRETAEMYEPEEQVRYNIDQRH
jgi:hypothetical protein